MAEKETRVQYLKGRSILIPIRLAGKEGAVATAGEEAVEASLVPS